MITYLNIISFAFIVASVTIIFRHSLKGKSYSPYFFIIISFLLLLFVTVTNILEHSGVSKVLDRYEDIIEILFIPFFVFSIYTFKINNELHHRKETEYFLQKILETTPASIYILDIELMKVKYLNRNRLGLEFSTPDLTDIPLNEIIRHLHPEDRQKINVHYKEIRNLNRKISEPLINEYRIETGQNNFITVNNFETVFSYTPNNKPKELIGIVFDITEKKKAFELLEQSESKYRVLYENANDAIFIIDKDLKIINCNSKAEILFNLSQDKIHSTSFLSFLPQNKTTKITHNEVIDLAVMALNKSTQVFETKLFVEKDKPIHAIVSFNKVYFNHKNKLQVIIHDITQIKELETKLLSDTIQAEERERKRFARELHDGVGPIISTIKMYFQWLAETVHDEKYKSIVEKGNANIEEAISSIREVSYNLSPHILSNYGLAKALEHYIDHIRQTSSLIIGLKYNFVERLDYLIEFTCYRVLTELINNTIKYAEAESIQIDLTKEQSMLLIKYSDNGKGFNVQEVLNQRKGAGLINIDNRIKTLGGDINILSEPNSGMQVYISFDLFNN